MSATDQALWMLSAIGYVQSAMVCGVSVWALAVYSVDPQMRPTLMLVASNLVMTIWVASSMIWRLQTDTLSGARVVAALAAFALCDYGIISLYLARKTRNLRAANNHIEALAERVYRLEAAAPELPKG